MAFKKPDPYKTDNATAPLNEEELARARSAKEVLEELGLDMPRPRGRPPLERPKERITIRLDADIVEHFRTQGRGWQSQINETLRVSIKKTG